MDQIEGLQSWGRKISKELPYKGDLIQLLTITTEGPPS